MADTYKIFPAIGVARVGNSPEYYLAPETTGELPSGTFPDDFRDANQLMKRQGVKFRVYCYPEAGGDPYEVIPGENGVDRIEWTVHLANKKAVWHNFEPVKGEGTYPPTSPLRNSSISDPAERATKLITDPGPRTLTGANQTAEFSRSSTPPEGYVMTFPPTTLSPNQIDSLGEIYTDTQGQLIVVGGYGNSGTDLTYPPANDIDYVNNDNWWDDTSDGPVSAKVVLSNGDTVEAATAWVAVTPPRFAPEIVPQITMYDVIFDVAVRTFPDYRPDIHNNGDYQTTYQTHPESEVQRILDRAYPYGAVSKDVMQHKFKYGDSLSNNYYGLMRSPEQANELGSGPAFMPMLSGDGSANSVVGTDKESKYVTFTETQMFFATQYNQGITTTTEPPETVPDALTRAALENCSGAAFAPGIEMTWFARRSEIYAEPFRLKKRDYDYPLSVEATPIEEGLEPGDFTKFMALPWQADFNECAVQKPLQNINSDYVNWWPAQRPLQVNRNGSTNVPWIGVDNGASELTTHLRFQYNTNMVDHWDELGFVLNMGTAERPDFVEVQRTLEDGSNESGSPSKPNPKVASHRP
ncbi:MAG: LodA/GoxA family CTQ-dependent oxidase [Crocosphaera sp.]|nr:LodA/GoxA family CTQ-dependent oxidase [Crocosphaera sp.]